MIGTLRKHQSWLWYSVIAATIFSFVAYFNPSAKYKQGSGMGDGGFNAGSVFGEPVTRDQVLAARNEAMIYYRLNTGEWPPSQDEKKINEIANNFILLSAELKQNHIEVTPEAAARFTKQIAGIKPEEPFSQEMLNQLLTKLMANAPQGLSPEDFIRFVHLSAGQQYLTAIYGMSGQLITSKEAEALYRRENEPIVAEVASFPAAAYEATINPTASDIADFYNKRVAQYRVPDQIEINYVEFPTTNYVAAGLKDLEKELGTNIDMKIDEIYAGQDPSTFRDATGTNALPAAAAKAKIKGELETRASVIEARKAAIAFVNNMLEGHDEQHPSSADDIFKTAKAGGLTVEASQPFDERTGPKDFELDAKQTRMLFAMTDNDPDDKDRSRLYLSSPILTEKAVYVVGLKKRIESHILPLESIRDEVEADYKHSKALDMARDAGKKFEEAAKAASTKNESFAQLCASQGAQAESLTPFSLTTPSIPEIKDRQEYQQIQEISYNIATGKISPFVPTSEGGLVVYVKQRMPVDTSKMAEQLPVYLARLRQQRQIAAFTQWLNHEYQLHANFPSEEKPQQQKIPTSG